MRSEYKNSSPAHIRAFFAAAPKSHSSALLRIQSRFLVVCDSASHEASSLRTFAFRRRARGSASSLRSKDAFSAYAEPRHPWQALMANAHHR